MEAGTTSKNKMSSYTAELSHNDVNFSDNETVLQTMSESTTTEEWTSKQITLIIVLGLITIITILSNSFVLYIFTTAKGKLRSATHLLLANMAVADLFVGIGVMPILASITILDLKWIFGEVLCLCFDYLHFLLCAASMFSMIGVSLERYIGVKYPLHHKQIMTRNRVLLLILAIWTLAAASTSIPLTIWLKPTTGISSVCFINLHPKLLMFVGIFIYWFPISSTILAYYIIYRTAVKGYSQSADAKGKKNDSTKNADTKSGNDTLTAARLRQARLTKSIVWITGLMFLSYAPVFVLFVFITFDTPFTMDLLIFVAWIRYCCSTVNPFMYALAVPGYRQEIRQTLFGARGNRKDDQLYDQSEITSYATTDVSPDSRTLIKTTNFTKTPGDDQYCTECGQLLKNCTANIEGRCKICKRKLFCASWVLPESWGTSCYFKCPNCPTIRYFDGIQPCFCQNCSHKFQPAEQGPPETKYTAMQRLHSERPSQNNKIICVNADSNKSSNLNLKSEDRFQIPILTKTPAIITDNTHVKTQNLTTFGINDPVDMSKLQTFANANLLTKLNDVDRTQKAEVVQRLRESVIGPLMERRSRLITKKLASPQINDNAAAASGKDAEAVSLIRELDEVVAQLQLTLDLLDDQNNGGNYSSGNKI